MILTIHQMNSMIVILIMTNNCFLCNNFMQCGVGIFVCYLVHIQLIALQRPGLHIINPSLSSLNGTKTEMNLDLTLPAHLVFEPFTHLVGKGIVLTSMLDLLQKLAAKSWLQILINPEKSLIKSSL